MPRICALGAILAIAVAAPARAQDPSFFYPAPPASSYTVSLDQPYGDLRMDVYRPAGTPGPKPVLILFNTVSGPDKRFAFYTAWAAIAASKGLVAILPDLRAASAEADLDALLAHLATNAAALGADPERIAVYAGSGNVFRGLPLFLNPRRTALKAAALYYGSAEAPAFRPDLPILFVRAGLDRPPVTRAIAELTSRALAENAPVTILNYPGGHHAFEMLDDELVTREVMDATIDFVIRATAPAYQASLRRGIPEATAAAHVAAGRFADAATAYAALVQARPDDPRLGLAYGEALLGASRFTEACAALERLKGKPLGPRDLGVPAARACVQAGDGDAAIRWLASIPARFRPRDLETDPVFAPVRARPEFRALFEAGR